MNSILWLGVVVLAAVIIIQVVRSKKKSTTMEGTEPLPKNDPKMDQQ